MILRTGTLDENVRDRSVVKRLQEVWNFEPAAEDREAADVKSNIAACTQSIPVGDGNAQTAAELAALSARLAMTGAANELACSGIRPEGAQVTVLLPEESEESLLRAITDSLRGAAKEAGVWISGFYGEATPAVTRPVTSVSTAGHRPLLQSENGVKDWNEKKAVAIETDGAADLLAIGAVGKSGTAILTAAREKELSLRFPQQFLEKARRMGEDLLVLPYLMQMQEAGIYPMQMEAASDGGIYAALWRLAEKGKGQVRGMTAELPDILIRQETVELADYYDINPYQMSSIGAVLAVVSDGEEAQRKLNERGVRAECIGRVQKGRDKVITNGDEKQNLNRPGPDALMQRLEQMQKSFGLRSVSKTAGRGTEGRTESGK